MKTAVKEDYKAMLEEQQSEVREMILAGLEQVEADRIKDFNEVCERLEKKYRDAAGE